MKWMHSFSSNSVNLSHPQIKLVPAWIASNESHAKISCTNSFKRHTSNYTCHL